MANNTNISMEDLLKKQQETDALLSSINPEAFNTKEGQDFLDNKEAGDETSRFLEETLEDVQNYESLVRNTKNAVEFLSDETKNNILATDIARNVLNIPNGEQQVAEDMAKAFAASYNAQHPVKFAMGQIGASLKVLSEIPNQIRENASVAKNAGMDYQNAMQKAAKAIAVKAEGAYNGTKDVVTTNAIAIAEKANNIYSTAVENLHVTWNKAKEGMVKALYAVGKAMDTGLEAITLGGWSRLCDRMYKDGMEAGKQHDGSHSVVEKLTKLGYEEDYKLFNEPIKDSKVAITLDKINDNLSKAMFSLHCKLTGDNTNEAIHQEYWGEIKQNVWGKDENALEGNFGCTSPMDKAAAGIDKVEIAIAKADRKTSEFVDKAGEKIVQTGKDAVQAGKDFAHNTKDKAVQAKDWTKEKAEIVSQFVKDIPENTKKCGTKAANYMKDKASEVGAIAVTTFANLRAGSLRLFAKLVDRVELAEKSAMRRNQSTKDSMEQMYNNAQNQINKLEAELESIAGGKVKANYTLPQNIADLKTELLAAKPTAEVTQALGMITQMEKSGTRKEEAKATITNMVHTLKNAGVVISDKLDIVDLKAKENEAVDRFCKAQERYSTHELRAENAKDFAQSLRDKADIIQGKTTADDDGEVVEENKYEKEREDEYER